MLILVWSGLLFGNVLIFFLIWFFYIYVIIFNVYIQDVGKRCVRKLYVEE